jgi:hypothetical protein
VPGVVFVAVITLAGDGVLVWCCLVVMLLAVLAGVAASVVCFAVCVGGASVRGGRSGGGGALSVFVMLDPDVAAVDTRDCSMGSDVLLHIFTVVPSDVTRGVST